MVTVPTPLAAALVSAQGDPAREWVARVPVLAAELLDRWSCVVAGPVRSGWAGLVVPVRRTDGGRAMLKISFPGEFTRFEPQTLATWAGQGAVLLLERDDDAYAMLLEELLPESLASVDDADAAMAIIGQLAGRLAVPAPPELPRLCPFFEQWAAELPEMSVAAGHPFPARTVSAAVATCAELGSDQPETVLHGDLNQTNVLRGTREEWLAIDPQGYAAEVAFECLTHLRDRWSEVPRMPSPERAVRRRIEIFAEAAGIEVERAVRWSHARAVIASLSGRQAGEEPVEVHDWLAITIDQV